MQWKLLMEDYKLVMVQFQTLTFKIHGRLKALELHECCLITKVFRAIKNGWSYRRMFSLNLFNDSIKKSKFNHRLVDF